MKYSFKLMDGKAYFATHIVTKEIEVNGKQETIEIPAYSLDDAKAIGGSRITEQVVPHKILDKVETLAGKILSKETFEQMLYSNDNDEDIAERVNLMENALNAMLGGEVNV